MCWNPLNLSPEIAPFVKRWKGLILAGILALTLSGLAVITGVWAQEDGDQPLRGVDRGAPDRDVEILSVEPQADDAVQIVASFPPEADTYIASGRPDENFGSDALFLGYNLTGDDYGAQRMLLRFDVESQIPPASVINDAQLRLHLVHSDPVNDEAMPTVVRRLASPWDEETVTWNSEPTWTDVDDSTAVGSAPGWYEWDLNGVVSDWVNEVVENNGVEIIGDEAEQQRERAFYSREMTTDRYPRLVVDYTVTGDTEPPDVAVDALPEYSRRSFTVSWSGDDPGGSGIDYYDVQYREGGGPWVNWQEIVTDTSAVFTGQDGHTYEFRARGMDNAGNLEPFGDPEAATTVDNRAPVAVVDPLPPAVTVGAFAVSWSGDDGDGSGIAHYDVRYRHDGDPWAAWLTETTDTSAVFNAPVDGLYEFEARAVDNVGHIEPFSNEPEAQVQVTIEPPSGFSHWLPLIAGGSQ